MPLYGQEINTEINPLEADLEFGLDLTKEGTVGIPALKKAKAVGVERKAVSLVAEPGRVARTGALLFHGGRQVGFVTSGGVSPTLDKTIARGLVASEASHPGTTIEADVRGKRYPFRVVTSPFYKRDR